MPRCSLTLSLSLFALILLGTLTAQFLEGQSVNAQSATEGVINAPQTHQEALTGTEKPILPVPGGLLIDAGAGSRELRGLDNLLGPHLGNAPDAGAYELGLGLPWHGPRSFSNLLAYGAPKGWQVSPLSSLGSYTFLGAPSSVAANDFRLLLTHSNPSAFILVTFEQMQGESRWSRLDTIVSGQAGDTELVKRVSFRDGLDARIVKRGENAQFLGGRVDDEGILSVLGGIAAGDLGRGASEAGLTLQDDFFTFLRSLTYAWYLQDVSGPISLSFVIPLTPGFAAVGNDAALSTGNAVRPGKLHGDVTLTNASIIWDVEGDANLNATATVQFRRQGTSQWRDALDLSRVKYLDEYTKTSRNRLAGSVFRLSPGTTYEVRVALSDSDGGSETRTTTFTTRQVPKPFQSGRAIEVRSTDDLDAVTATAQPGDTFLLHAGIYDSDWTIVGKSGTREKPILFRAYGDGVATFARIIIQGDYIWLDGLGITTTTGTELTNRAVVTYQLNPSDAMDGLTITRSTVRNGNKVLHTKEANEVLLADNVVLGAGLDQAGTAQSLEAIEFDKWTRGHVVAFNDVAEAYDGVSWGEGNVDVHNNRIHDVYDDAIEPDYAWDNYRVWENVAWKSTHHNVSFQPERGGPWYIFRNQLTGGGDTTFKMRNNGQGSHFITNNSIVSPGGTLFSGWLFPQGSLFSNNYWKVRSSLGGVYDAPGDENYEPDPKAMRLWSYNRYDVHPCTVWRWWGILQNAQARGAEAHTLLVNDPTGSLAATCGAGAPPSPSPSPPPAPLPPVVGGGLVGYWKFEEGAGTVAEDSSGRGNNGTLANGPLWGSSTLSASPRAIAFDGADDVVLVYPTFSFSATAPRSVSLWFRSSQTGRSLIHQRGNSMYLYLASATTMQSWLGSTSNTWTVPAWNDGKWHHVGWTFDGMREALSFDGMLLAAQDESGSASSDDHRMSIGGAPALSSSEYMNGLIDEICVFNEALGAEEITKLYNNGTGLSCDQLNPALEELCIAVHPENRVRLGAQDFSGLATTLTITDPQGIIVYSGIHTPTTKEGEIRITDPVTLAKISDTTMYTLTAHPESHRRRKMTLLGSALKAAPCDPFPGSSFGFLDESGPVTIQHLVRLIAHYRTQTDAAVNRAFLNQRFTLRDLISVIRLYVMKVGQE